jgi:protein phosphatase
MTHTLRYAARTDRGLLRANNQDSVFAGNRLLVVADGMGGHVAGDTASRLAVAAFAPLDQYDPHGRDLLTPLEHATEDGNGAIADMVTDDPQLDGMGTTVTALMFDGPRLGVAHVGDSRAYLWRGGVLSQITHDDTFVQSLIDEGRITEAEAAQHPQRSLLLRALNGTDVEPTLAMREARVGDRYLICSDGLSGVISAEAIADTLASYETAEAADRLIELALRGGGPDNVTVIVADVMDVGQTPALETAPPTPLDADATGPLDEMRFTKRMPRVALPREPDVATLAAQAAAAEAAHRSFTEPITSPNRLDPARHFAFDDDELDELDGLDDHEPDDLEDDEGLPSRSSRVAGPPRRSRRWVRRIGLAVAIVALLVVGGVLGVNWVGTQYYVGDNNGQVAVFRGVDGSILGIDLSSAQEGSCWSPTPGCIPLHTTDLVPAARDQVIVGIPATDLQNAREILLRLDGQKLPLCSTFPATPAPPAPSLLPGTAGPTTPAAGTAGSPADPTGTTGIPTDPTGPATELLPPAPTGAGSATTLTFQTPQPDINCRIG